MTQPLGTTRWVIRDGLRIHVREMPGTGPVVVLMHGFPDDLHLYDHLMPHLAARHRVISFDFLGWGESDKPSTLQYTSANQTRDLDAVMSQLVDEPAILVAHDASGPPAIDWTLDNPDRVHTLVLLNTYYAAIKSLRRPPAIALYSTPVLRVMGRALARASNRLDRWIYHAQVGRFVTDPARRRDILEDFYPRFKASREAFWELNEDLISTVLSRRHRVAEMRRLGLPVLVVFGADDRWLNPGVARWFAHQFPHSQLHLVSKARHYVQVDQPETVARLILEAAAAPPTSGANR